MASPSLAPSYLVSGRAPRCRWVLMCCAPLLAALGGCFGGWGGWADDCEAQKSVEVSSWTLGTHVGTLTWLWTGSVTELSMTGTAPQFSPAECDPQVTVVYALSTADGAIDQSLTRYAYVPSDGNIGGTQLSLEFEAPATLTTRVAPQLVALAQRHPRLRLVIPRDSSDGELRLLTEQDDVALAQLQFRSTP